MTLAFESETTDFNANALPAARAARFTRSA
jgi:hypothetical protein